MKNVLVLLVAVFALAIPAWAQQRTELRVNTPSAAAPPQNIDIDSYNLDIKFTPEEQKVDGSVDIVLRPLERNSVATLDLDRHFKVANVTAGGVGVRFRQFEYDSTFEVDLANGVTAADGTITV